MALLLPQGVYGYKEDKGEEELEPLDLRQESLGCSVPSEEAGREVCLVA